MADGKITIVFYGTLEEWNAHRDDLLRIELYPVYLGEIGSGKINTPAVRTPTNLYWGRDFYRFIASRSGSSKMCV